MSMSNALTVLIGSFTSNYAAIKTKLEFLVTNIKAHLVDVENPHRVDKFDVGLGKVQNQAPATPEQAVAGKNNNTVMSPLRVDQYTTDAIYDPLITLFDATIADLDS
jgi:hypothetical protein